MNIKRVLNLGVLFLLSPICLQSVLAGRSHHSSSKEDPVTVVIGFVFTIVVVIVMCFINSSRQRKPATEEEVKEMDREWEIWVERFKSQRFSPPATSILLQSDEIPLLEEASALAEARAVRVYGGGGTRVQGVYIGGGESTSFDELKDIDSGTLTFTTQRLVFTGQLQQRVTAIRDVVSALPYGGDAIIINSQRRAKAQVYTVRNPILWASAIQCIIKGVLKIKKVVEEADSDSNQRRASRAALKNPDLTNTRYVMVTTTQMAYLTDLGIEFDHAKLTKADADRLISRALAADRPNESQKDKVRRLGFVLKDDEDYTMRELDEILDSASQRPDPQDLAKLQSLKIDLSNGNALDCRMMIELDEAFRADDEFNALGSVGIAKACAAATKDPDLFKVTLRHSASHGGLVFSWPQTKLREWAAKTQ
jgi:hypothetical protein